MSRELSQSIISCKIIDADYITKSDHKIIQAQFTTGFSQKSRPIAINRRLKGKKRVLKLEKATEEDWEGYRMKLKIMFKKKLNINTVAFLVEVHIIKKNLDEL